MKTLEHLTLFAPACLSVSKDRGVGDGGWMGGPIDVLRVWLGIGVQIFLFFWHTETILQGKKRNALFQTCNWESQIFQHARTGVCTDMRKYVAGANRAKSYESNTRDSGAIGTYLRTVNSNLEVSEKHCQRHNAPEG